MNEELLSIQKAAKSLKVSTKTLRRWEKQGKLVPQRTKGSHRRYTLSQITSYLKKPKVTTTTTTPVASNVQVTARSVSVKSEKNYSFISGNFPLSTDVPVQIPTESTLPHLSLFHPAFHTARRFVLPGAVAAILIAVITSAAVAFLPARFKQASPIFSRAAQNDVLAAATSPINQIFAVNIPSKFAESATFEKDLQGQTATFKGNITAPNIIYSLTAGTGITVTGGQTATITNSDPGSAQKNFSTITAAGTSITASSNTDTLTLTQGSGISLSSSGKTITIGANIPTPATGPWTLSGSNVYLATLSNSVGIGNNSPGTTLDVTGTLRTSSTVTFSSLTTNGGVLYANGSGLLSQTAAGTGSQCLLGGTTPAFASCPGGSSDTFLLGNGFIYPADKTVDFILGGQTIPSAKFAVLNMSSGTPIASVSATSGTGLSMGGDGTIQSFQNAALTFGGSTTGSIILNPLNGTGLVTVNGTLNVTSGYQINGTAGISEGSPSCVTTSNGIVIGTGTCQLGSEQWIVSDGAVYTGNPSLDLFLGGTSTASAKFGLLNVSGGTPTASISANSGNNALYITGSGTLATTNKQTLTLGSSSTGNIVFSNGLSTGIAHINAAGVLSSSAINLASGDVTGILPILNGGTNNSVIGSAGAVAFSDSSKITYTGVGNSSQCLLGGTTPAFGNCGTGITTDVFWNQTSGLLFANNSTVDFSLGGQASTSAKFAVLNINTGTPTASISGGLNGTNGMYLTADGTLATLQRTSLTIGNSTTYNTTGNVLINPNGTGNVGIGTSTVPSLLTVSGDVKATTINGNTITTGTGILTLAASKTLTVNDTTSLNSNSIGFAGTESLSLAAAKNVTFADEFITSGSFSLTLTTTASTNVTLPTTGTLLTNTAAANQTITSTQNTGTVFGITDATNNGSNIVGQAITLSGTGSHDQTGLSFALSGATGTNLNDILGSSSTWKVSTTGNATFASVTGSGASGDFGYWNRTGGAIFASNTTNDLLLGGTATTSAKFAVLNMAAGLTPIASLSGGLNGTNGMYLTADGTLSTLQRTTLTIGNSSTYNTTGNVLINSNAIGNVGIGTTNPLATLDVTGNVNIAPTGTSNIIGLHETQSINIPQGVLVYGMKLDFTGTTQADDGTTTQGTRGFQLNNTVNGSHNSGTFSGIYVQNYNNSTAGTVAHQLAGVFRSYMQGTGTVGSALAGVYATAELNAAGTVTNAMPLDAAGVTISAGTVTNLYGLYIGGNAISGTGVANTSSGIYISAFNNTASNTSATGGYINYGVNDTYSNQGGNTSGSNFNVGLSVSGAGGVAASGGTMNNFGLDISMPSGASVLGGTQNSYGIRITGNGPSGAGTDNNFAFRGDSAAQYYFNGVTTIGSSASNGDGFRVAQNGTAGTNAVGSGFNQTITGTSSVGVLSGVNANNSYTSIAGSTNSNIFNIQSSFTTITAGDTINFLGAIYAGARGTLASGTVTNGVGLYIEAATIGTNKYGIYQNGSSDKNYFAGNVGIGSTAPRNVLDVTGSASFSANLIFNGSGNSTNAVAHNIDTYEAGTLAFNMYGNGAGTSGSTAIQILANGNVGIGTTTAVSTLQVMGSGTGYLSAGNVGNSNYTGINLQGSAVTVSGTGYNFLSSPTDTTLYINANTQMRFRIANVDKGALDGNGNLGIGTIKPLAKLDVTGSASISANIVFNGNGVSTNGFAHNINTYEAGTLAFNMYGNGAGTSGTTALYIAANGAVGISTTSPAVGSIFDVNGKLTVLNNGNIGIGSSSPVSILNVVGTNGSGNALAIFNQTQTGANADLFTASLSGTTKFVIDHNGNVGIGTNIPTSSLAIGATSQFTVGSTGNLATSGTVTFSNATFSGGNNNVLYAANSTGVLGAASTNSLSLCLVSGASNPSWTACPGGSSAADLYWNQSSTGLLFANNSTVDFSLGGQATTSAKFAVLNMNSGTPMASISGGLNGTNGMYLTADGTLATLQRTSLTIGNSSTYNTTGNVLINPNGTGNVGIGTTNPLATLDITGTLRASSTITLSALNVNGGVLFTNNSGVVSQTATSTSSQCLLGGTTPAFGNCGTGITTDVFWNQSSTGLLFANNSTVDFSLGGQATTSAKFAVLNMAAGLTPTASLSGGLNGTNGLSLGADGTIQSLQNTTLTLGGATTGNIILSPLNGSGGVTINGALGLLNTAFNTSYGANVNLANGQRGLNVGLTSTLSASNASVYGQYNTLTYSSASNNPGIIAGARNDLSSTSNSNGTAGTNGLYGTYNSLSYTGATSNYGTYNIFNSGANTSTNSYGTYTDFGTTTATATNGYGAYNSSAPASDVTATREGVHNAFNHTSNPVGINNVFSTDVSGGSMTGLVNTFTTSGSPNSLAITGVDNEWTIARPGTIIGLNNTIDNSAAPGAPTLYGVYNSLKGNASASGGSVYGVYTTLTNNGTASGTGSNSYGIYSTLKNTTTNAATITYGDYITEDTNSNSGNIYGLHIDLGGTNTSVGRQLLDLSANEFPGSGATVNAGNITITDKSTNSSSADVVNGLTMTATINTTGAGTKTFNGYNVAAPTFTTCTTGACTFNGINVDATSPTSQVTVNDLNLSGATAPASSTITALSIGNVTGGAGTETAIKIGTGWDYGLTVGTVSPVGYAHIAGGQFGGNAALVVDQLGESTNDLFTASASGTTKFTINNNGNLQFTGGQTSALITLTSSNTTSRSVNFPVIGANDIFCLLTLANCGSTGIASPFEILANTGAIEPLNSTTDFMIGGQASTSAKFAVLNINTGTPTASISGGLNGTNGMYLTADGTLATLQRTTLTIGNSTTYNTTGNVLINPNGTGNVGIGTSTVPSLLTVSGDVKANTINGNTITAGTGILTLSASKTLSVTDSTTLNTNSIAFNTGGAGETLTLAAGKNVTFADAFSTSGAFPLTLTTTASTNVTLPITGTLLTNTAAANQTITSTQTSGTLFSLLDSTNIAGATIGMSITLSGTGVQDQTGLSFALSGATGTNLNDILGSSSTWKISTTGNATFASISPSGASGTFGYFNRNAGAIFAGNTTNDLLLGGTASTSAKFAVLNVAAGLTPIASLSGGLNGTNGMYLTADGTLATLNRTTLTIGNSATYNTTGNVLINPNGTGNVGIGTTANLTSTLFVGGTTTSNALVTFDQRTATGDIFTASAAGTTKFVIDGNGNVGIGTTLPGAKLDIAGVATGTISQIAYPTSTVQTGNVIGQKIDLSTNFTAKTGDSVDVTGLNILTPTLTESAPALHNIAGINLSTASSLTTQTDGVINFYGARIVMPNITQTGGTLASYGLSLTPGTVTTGGTQYGINMGNVAGNSAGTSTGIQIGTGWNYGAAIGTTSPVGYVQISGGNRAGNAALVVDQLGATTNDIFAASSSGTTKFVIKNDGTASSSAGFTIDGLGNIQSTKNQTLTIGGNTTGNILVNPRNGTAGGFLGPVTDNVTDLGASPSARFRSLFLGPSSLHIQCTTGDGCGGSGLDYALGVNTSTGTFSIGVNGTTATGNPLLNITQGGNVGIGIAAPQAAIDAKDVSSLATLGSEDITNAQDSDFGDTAGTIHWTTSGSPAWRVNIASSKLAAKDAPGTGALTLTTTNLNTAPASGQYYQITFTYTTTASSSGTLTPKFGFVSGTTVGGAASDTQNGQIQVIKTSGDGSLQFIPTMNWYGTIDTVSVKLFTPSTVALRLQSSDGTANPLEIRTGGSALDNTFIGNGSGKLNVSGNFNTAMGWSAFSSNITGTQNTALGEAALISNTTGSYNTAVGLQALASNISGSGNSILGVNALTSNTTGSNNTAFGYQAGYTATDANANITGSNNIFIGYNSGPGSATQLTEAGAFGYNALVNQNYSIVLGGTGADAVQVGIGTQTPSAGVLDLQGGSKSGNAALIVNQTGATTNDIFTASASGTPKFVISNNGNLQFTGNTSFLTTLNSAATAARNITFPDAAGTICLQSSGSCGFSVGTNWWTTSSDGKALAPINSTLDLLAGGQASTSAKFAVLNLAAGLTPTASLSGGLNGTNGLSLDAAGNIQTLQNTTLTIGGSTTGNIALKALNGTGLTSIISTGANSPIAGVQLQVGYNSTNYLTAAVGSTGSTTFDLAGTTPTFTFAKNMTISTGGLTLGNASNLGVLTLSVAGGGGTNPTIAADASNNLTIQAPSGLTTIGNGNGDITFQPSSAYNIVFNLANSSATGDFLLENNGTVFADFTHGSYFGIGTTAPSSVFHLKGTYGSGNALAIFDQTQVGVGSDVFTASVAGSTKFVINQAGNTGIGTSIPGFKLDVQDTQTATAAAEIWNIAANSATVGHTGLIVKLGAAGSATDTIVADDSFIKFLRGDGRRKGQILGSTTGVTYETGQADYAEYFSVDPSLVWQKDSIFTQGTLVCQGPNGVVACENGSGPLIGVVSITAGFVGNSDATDRVLVGMVGQLPVKVTATSGTIHVGDAITSLIPSAGSGPSAGIAGVAHQAGMILGHAMKDYDPSQGNQLLAITLQLAWYDPSAYLTDNGQVAIGAPDGNGKYPVTINNTGDVAQKIGAFEAATIGNLNAGSITAKTLTIDQLRLTNDDFKIGNVSLNDYVARVATSSAVLSSLSSSVMLACPASPGDSGCAPAYQNDVATVSAGLATVNDNIATVTNNIATVSAQLAISNQQLASSSGAITDLQQSSNSTIQQFGTLQTNVNQINDRITTLNGMVSSLASISAMLATSQQQLASRSAYMDITKLDVGDATVSGSLEVLGRTTLTDLGVTGNINAGVIAIHGNDGAINTLGGPLKLQDNSLNGVDIANGKVTIDQNGNMHVSGTITADTVKANNFEVLGATTGTASISAGLTSVTVPVDYTDNYNVFLTPRTLTDQQLTVTNKTATGFTVSVLNAPYAHIDFDWWIVGKR